MSVYNSKKHQNNKSEISSQDRQFSKDKLVRLKKHVNQANRRIKFSTLLTILPIIGIIPSAMGRSAIGDANDRLHEFDDKDFKALTIQKAYFNEKIAGRIKGSRGISQINLLSQVAGILLTPFHLIGTVPTNVANWRRTGNLKKRLRQMISEAPSDYS